MALTPEDVVNKRFQQTKFREGYDQDEVDDFLDEVVVQLRELVAENDALKAENEALKRGDGAAVAASGSVVEVQETQEFDDSGLRAEIQQLQERNAALEQERNQARADAERALAANASGGTNTSSAAPLAAAAPSQGLSDGEISDAETSSSLLVLARRLHDEHVAEGTRKRDSLVSEGEERANKLLSDAQAEAERTTRESEEKAAALIDGAEQKAAELVSNAQNREREITSRLEANKSKLEERIEELRGFERDYRTNLRSYIETQLNDLNSSSNEFDGNQNN